jgi:hypothetical protein
MRYSTATTAAAATSAVAVALLTDGWLYAHLEPERINNNNNNNLFITCMRVRKGEETGGDKTRGKIG